MKSQDLHQFNRFNTQIPEQTATGATGGGFPSETFQRGARGTGAAGDLWPEPSIETTSLGTRSYDGLHWDGW